MRHLLALLVLVSLAVRAEAAAKSVTLLGVSGAGGSRFADLLEQDLGELYEVVAGDVYRGTAERLDKRGASPEEVQAVCGALRIDAVIGGSISGEGRARVLSIAVREGASGEVIARKRFDLSGTTLPQLREAVVRDLVRALERARPRGSLDHPVLEAPLASEIPSAPEDVGTTTVVQKRHEREPAQRGIYAGVGLSIATRSLRFDTASAPGYRGGTVAGIRADGVVFPLSLSTELAEAHPVLASFGISGSYERAFGVTSSTSSASIAGHASRWSALLVGRIPLGHGARGGYLTIETGLQSLSWTSDSPLALGVPDAGYQLVDAGLRWEHTLGTPVALLVLRAAYLGLVGSSGISSTAEYGAVGGGGLEAEGSLIIRPTRWLFLRLDARYTPVFLSFAASGTRYARSATEQWVSGLLEVGFAL